MRIFVIIFMKLLTITSLCSYKRSLIFEQVQKIPINSTLNPNYKVAISFDGSIIVCVNVSSWAITYQFNETTGLFSDHTTIDLGFHTVDFEFGKITLKYSTFMSTGQFLYLKTTDISPRNISATSSLNKYGLSLTIGNSDLSILFCSIENFQDMYKNLYFNSHYNFITFDGSQFSHSVFDDCYWWQCPQLKFRAVLSGKGTTAVFLRYYSGLDVRKFNGYSYNQIWQTLVFRNTVNNGEYDWMTVDFSYNETFIVASVRLYSFTVWMLRQDGYYHWLQTENLTDGANNMTIKKLRFDNNQLKLFVATDKQARIYTKNSINNTRQSFMLSYSLALSPSSYSDMSADGTTIAALSNSSLSVFRLTEDRIISEIDPMLYSFLVFGLLPFSLIMYSLIILFVIKRYGQSICYVYMVFAAIFRRGKPRAIQKQQVNILTTVDLKQNQA